MRAASKVLFLGALAFLAIASFPVSTATHPGVHTTTASSTPGCNPGNNFCTSGQAAMSLGEDCPLPRPSLEHVCTWLSGSAEAGESLLPDQQAPDSPGGPGTSGQMSASLEHMGQPSCSWVFPQTSCSVVFRDGGSTIHKHWHPMDNVQYCHPGSSRATVYPFTGEANAAFSACYRFVEA